MGNIKQTRITLRKGLKSDLPSHAPLGEPLYCIDTHELYIGMGNDEEIAPFRSTDIEQQINVHGVTCKVLGMTPNNESKARQNTLILEEAINKGFKIIVDDMYFIDTNNTRITNNIYLEGSNSNSGFNIVYNSSGICLRLNTGVDIHIKNIKFLYEGESHIYFIYNESTNWYSNEFIFENNAVEGGVNIIYAECDRNLNPMTTKLGFKFFKCTGNTITRNKSMTFNLYNVPGEYIFSHNTVRNFVSRIFNNSISNAKPHETEFMKSINFEITHNNVKNDIDFWGDPGDAYYTFILVEGNKLIYEYNSVEGMKKQGPYLYDIYANCVTVIYRNNLNKNNVATSSTLLVMSKEGITEDNELVRIYEDNEFVIEKSYLDTCNFSEDTLIEFFNIATKCEKFKFSNNKVHIEGNLALRAGTAPMKINCFEFSGNNMFIKKGSNCLFPVTMYKKENSKGYCKIIDNMFDLEDGEISLVRIEDTNKLNVKFSQLLIENNIFKGTICLGGSWASKFILSNNTFMFNPNSGSINFTYLGNFGEFINNNNKFLCYSDSQIFRPYRTTRGFDTYLENNEYYYNASSFNYGGIGFGKTNKKDKDTTINYVVEIETYFKDLIEKDVLYFTYGYDKEGDYNYIEYTNKSGSKERLNMSTETDTRTPKFTSTNSSPKVGFRIVTFSEGVYVQFHNNANYPTLIKTSIKAI